MRNDGPSEVHVQRRAGLGSLQPHDPRLRAVRSLGVASEALPGDRVGFLLDFRKDDVPICLAVGGGSKDESSSAPTTPSRSARGTTRSGSARTRPWGSPSATATTSSRRPVADGTSTTIRTTWAWARGTGSAAAAATARSTAWARGTRSTAAAAPTCRRGRRRRGPRRHGRRRAPRRRGRRRSRRGNGSRHPARRSAGRERHRRHDGRPGRGSLPTRLCLRGRGADASRPEYAEGVAERFTRDVLPGAVEELAETTKWIENALIVTGLGSGVGVLGGSLVALFLGTEEAPPPPESDGILAIMDFDPRAGVMILPVDEAPSRGSGSRGGTPGPRHRLPRLRHRRPRLAAAAAPAGREVSATRPLSPRPRPSPSSSPRAPRRGRPRSRDAAARREPDDPADAPIRRTVEVPPGSGGRGSVDGPFVPPRTARDAGGRGPRSDDRAPRPPHPRGDVLSAPARTASAAGIGPAPDAAWPATLLAPAAIAGTRFGPPSGRPPRTPRAAARSRSPARRCPRSRARRGRRARGTARARGRSRPRPCRSR